MATNNRNFSLDPLFCDPEGDEYGLAESSPCVAPGPTGCGLIGALATSCGTVSVDEMSWGRIKAGYRAAARP